MGTTRFARASIRKVPLLRADEKVRSAISILVGCGLPSLPVVEQEGRLLGIFGEQEFIAALFPGYLGQLRSAAFVPQSLDELLERRLGCGDEPVSQHANTERVAVGLDHSDIELAEIFLHHPVLIVPVVDQMQLVQGVVTRTGFFEALARHFLERAS